VASDPIIAFEFGKKLIGDSQVRGLALAKLLYRLKESWPLFEAAGTGDSLENMAYTEIGRSPQTVTKYIRLWESVFANEEIPLDVRNQLMGRPVKDLLLITALAREGSDEDTFRRIANAADHNEVRDIVKGERGGRTSSGTAVRVFIEMREGANNPPGTLYVQRGDGQKVLFGYVSVLSPDEKVQKAIARITQCAAIQEVR
jgi:hypothetical protein